MVADVSMTSHWFYPGSVSWILLDAHCLYGHKCRALLTHIMTVFSNKYHCHKSIFHFLLLMSCVHHIDLHFKAGYRLSSPLLLSPIPPVMFLYTTQVLAQVIAQWLVIISVPLQRSIGKICLQPWKFLQGNDDLIGPACLIELHFCMHKKIDPGCYLTFSSRFRILWCMILKVWS